jgi:ABC-type antimicrobial peptide transport system permease subunit
VVSSSLAMRRFTTLLVLVFAASALLLTIVGLYGVVAYSLSQRRSEIGLRAALGARPAALRRHFLGQAMAIAGVGVVAGAAIMFAGGRLLSGLLFGVHHSDPRIYVGVGAILLLVAALAALEPAQRASRTDPARILRAD